MTFDDLTSMTCTIEAGVARVVLDQPDRGNPVDGTFCREIQWLATELSGRDEVRAVLMTGKGRFFSVGGDIRSFARSRAEVPSIVRTWTAGLHSAIARFMRMRAPFVVAAQGSIAGGSVSLAAAADLLYVVEDAGFTAGFPMIGFSADSGSTVTLTQRIGAARTKRFLLTNETIPAKEALAIGLCDYVASAEDLMPQAEAMAKKLAGGATQAYGGIKQLMLRARHQGLESQMEDEAQMLAAISASDDAWEGISAFQEKRKPDFRGR